MAGLVRDTLAAVVLAGMLAVVQTTTVAAECDGPFPSFRKVAVTAELVVIGDVVGIERGGAWDPAENGVSSVFALQLRHVLRGEAPALMQFRDLPTQPCASVVGVRLGDRIALAIGGSDFSPPVEANMVAWIERAPPPGFTGDVISEADVFTEAEVFSLLGVELPSEQAPPVEAPPGLEAQIPILVILAAAMAVAIGWRMRRRGTDATTAGPSINTSPRRADRPADDSQ